MTCEKKKCSDEMLNLEDMGHDEEEEEESSDEGETLEGLESLESPRDAGVL